jgi:transcriptional repressor NrdR
MVCVYCDSPTQVVNSRLQRRGNHIWRRRKCLSCSSVFTTTEHPELTTSFAVDHPKGLMPFSRDRLFIAIYESCKHRPTALADATSLVELITRQILAKQQSGVVHRVDIVQTALLALQRFDATAATIYAAYHP